MGSWQLQSFRALPRCISYVSIDDSVRNREASMTEYHKVAATIAAALLAQGRTLPEDITKAVEVYQLCLDELERRSRVKLGYPAATPEQEREAYQEGYRIGLAGPSAGAGADSVARDRRSAG
jgi:hypothetical protein